MYIASVSGICLPGSWLGGARLVSPDLLAAGSLIAGGIDSGTSHRDDIAELDGK
jgi:hypothetical protein